MSYGKQKTPRQKKRLKWLVDATSWRRIGEETLEEEVLVTRIKRKPPSYRLEHFVTVIEGDPPAPVVKTKVAMLIKAPKGQKGYNVQLDEKHGFQAPTRRKAIIAFAALAAREEEETNDDQD
jgi:hypothetical protein